METGRPSYDIDKMMFTHVEDRRNYTQAGVMSPEDIALQEEEEELYKDQPVARARQPLPKTGTEVSWCPGTAARNWENDAYSPKTGLLYTATQTSAGRCG